MVKGGAAVNFTFSLTLLAGAPDRLTVMSGATGANGEALVVENGTTCGTGVRVRVEDRWGNPIASVDGAPAVTVVER